MRYHQSDTSSCDEFESYLELFKNKYKEKYGSSEPYYSNCVSKARERYLFKQGIAQDEFSTLYHLSSSKGLGDGARCVERNTLSNNLLNFFGFPCININSEISINGQLSFRNYNIFKLLENKNYMIFDTALHVCLAEVPEGHNLETSFTLHTSELNDITYIVKGTSGNKTRKKENN